MSIEEKQRISIRDTFREKGTDGPPLLHGSDVPAKVNSVIVTCKELRSAPKDFKSIAILDFTKPVYGCEAWAVNKTSIKLLLERFGLTDEDEISDLSHKMAGKKITLGIAMANNPKTGKMVRTLFPI